MLAWVFVVGTLVFSAGPNSAAHVLDVPYRNQLDGSAYALANCGPTALSMVLAYYGIDAAPSDLRMRAMQAQHSWIDDDGGYSDDYGVFVYNLASVAEVMGLHSTGLWSREGVRFDTLHQWQPSDVRREIQADHPVIVEVGYRAMPSHARSNVDDDHYIVLHGTVGSDFIYSDPLGNADGGPDQTISERDLTFAMSEASTPRVGFALLKSAARFEPNRTEPNRTTELAGDGREPHDRNLASALALGTSRRDFRWAELLHSRVASIQRC